MELLELSETPDPAYQTGQESRVKCSPCSFIIIADHMINIIKAIA